VNANRIAAGSERVPKRRISPPQGSRGTSFDG
jgi:hypothetical protein